jgi:hypothetical protein
MLNRYCVFSLIPSIIGFVGFAGYAVLVRDADA